MCDPWKSRTTHPRLSPPLLMPGVGLGEVNRGRGQTGTGWGDGRGHSGLISRKFEKLVPLLWVVEISLNDSLAKVF